MADAPDFTAEPIEAGMGGCPWRIVVCGIVYTTSTPRDGGLRRTATEAILRQYPTPQLMVAANPDLLLQELSDLGIRLPSRCARLLQTMSYQWLQTDWQTMYDLPGVGYATSDALIQYARQRPAAS